jgi:hypothetical protein
MLDYAEPISRLIDELRRLPGIGHKSAQRIASYLLRVPLAEAQRLTAAIEEVRAKIIFCSVCNNFTDQDPCRYCTNPARDRSIICVIEEPNNLVAIEKTREYHGLYHVLHSTVFGPPWRSATGACAVDHDRSASTESSGRWSLPAELAASDQPGPCPTLSMAPSMASLWRLARRSWSGIRSKV